MQHHAGRFFAWVAVLLAGTLLPGLAAAEPNGRRPNIVVIVADDLGYADLGCHGSKDIPTPNIDALATRGVRCTDAYAAAPVGGPSRAALLTGRYPQRFGFEFNPPREGPVSYGLPTTETTLADVLGQAGYATALVGKWHLGHDAESQPLRRGFGEFFGFLDGAHYYLDPHVSASGSSEKSLWPNGMIRGTKPVEEKQYLTEAFTREALAFIERHRRDPFFLLLAYNAPHTPLEATATSLARVRGVTGGNQRRHVYAAMIAALDDGVGAVTSSLEAAGLLQDTLVIFVSDNGGITGYLSPSSNAPLIGTKSELLEGGIRVPFLVQWPGHVPAGVTYQQPVSLLDVFSTAVAAAGARPPAARPLDGVDLLPHLSGNRREAPHQALYWRYGKQSAVREGNYKLLRADPDPDQLYDLTSDIGESRDLTTGHADTAGRLNDRLKAWDAQLVPPAWNKPNAAPWW